jgi:hypothetical protein
MPRSSRALLSAEIRTSGEPGSATAVALMGFLPSRSETGVWKRERQTDPLLHPFESRTRRARAHEGLPEFPEPRPARFGGT